MEEEDAFLTMELPPTTTTWNVLHRYRCINDADHVCI